MSKQPIKVFISYAHKDEPYKDELNIYLAPYERKKMIEIWDDRDILPGQMWDNEINNALYDADVVLFLVSPYFMASGYIDGVELKNAIDLHKKKSLVLIPIIIRPSDMSMLDIRQFQAVPKNAKPISTWDNVDEAWLDVASQLGKLFRSIYNGDFKLNKQNASDSSDAAAIPEANVDLEEIKAMITRAELKQAVEKMLALTSSKFPDLNNQVIMQSSRLSQLTRNETMGMVDFNSAGMIRAQITNALLSLLGELKRVMS